MDPLDVVGFARALIDIDSTTGKEPEAGAWLATRLREMGFTVVEQPLGDGRHNVFAHLGPPHVVLSTHYDCVPPYFPSSLPDGRLYGRGACDAKGILAAEVAAVLRLKARGERRVGLLFVAGEERGSDGAIAANDYAPGSRFLINGEPTDGRLGSATRGVLRVRLHATGRAAHSATPGEGDSAIERLLDALILLRTIHLPSDPDLGDTFYNVGLIEGGVAPNVVAPSASAEVLFRTVGPAETVMGTLAALTPLVRIERTLQLPVVRLMTVPGMPADVFPFTTDIPFLDRWGKPLLFGPGSILLAHTEREHILVDELLAAVATYEKLAMYCLEESPS
ncbi:MAG TPA: M20/M25/M40 family metallo-hydrolase [Vicinamibacterales bacterium]|nr:M20/M25/M40 family metallo-hydrolase [Vicinamibacterales bacterium]